MATIAVMAPSVSHSRTLSVSVHRGFAGASGADVGCDGGKSILNGLSVFKNLDSGGPTTVMTAVSVSPTTISNCLFVSCTAFLAPLSCCVLFHGYLQRLSSVHS